jgi:N-methylhydantoinase A
MSNDAASGLIAAVDIGGTFTDSVLVQPDGRVAYGKALSSPGDDFQSGFFGSLASAATLAGHEPDDVFRRLTRLVSHGSTVATNIVVEGKGAKVGLLTTKGHEDTLLMMRGLGRVVGEPPENVLRITRTSKPAPLVPRERIRGVTERVDSTGQVVVGLDGDEVEACARELAEAGCEAFAICFLWSTQNPEHEQRARDIVKRVAPDAFVTVSSELSSAVGEYERTVAAVVNAFVGPRTSGYLQKLEERLGELGFRQGLMLMQCNGGMVPLEDGSDRPILTIGSGPVGGMVGTQRLAAELGIRNVIATDMGGTSFDVGIIRDLEPEIASETVLDKYTYRIPAVEVLSIGAGGGSIAWMEPHSGTLRVGPHSASSNPGPACYGLGGREPTVTDADLVLGYLDPDAVFGTAGERQIRPDRDLAEQAIRRVAEPLGLSVTDAALGIVEIINAKMANLLENVVVGRGFDPRDFTIFSFGGSGAVHAAGYARELGISEVLIPGEVASVWSALGIALSDVRYTREGDVQLVSPIEPSELQAAYAGLEDELRAQLANGRANGGRPEIRRYARMRYEWQRNELEVGVPAGELDADTLAAVTADFEQRYEQRYGAAALLPDARFEIVNVRSEAFLPTGVDVRSHAATPGSGDARKPPRLVAFERGAPPRETPVYDGTAVPAGDPVAGPAVIDLPTTAIVVPPDATVRRTERGDFHLTFQR